MAHNTMGALGAMAGSFVTPQAGFNADHEFDLDLHKEDPNSSFGFDNRTMNTKAAVNSAYQLGGGPLNQSTAMMAGLLPAALKIEELKKMQGVASEYYKKYIKDFNRKYGFSDPQVKELVKEFNDVTAQITNLIPDEGMRNMYKKYIESYPTMYLSMIPAEALQTKLAVKCVTDNRKLRHKIEEMSSCVSSLVRNLTDLQISAGIPPIVNLMFESMPDPLTAMTDPMYHKYNNAIVTYHKLLQDEGTNDRLVEGNFKRLEPVPDNAPIESNAEFLRMEPVNYLKQLAKDPNGQQINLKDGGLLQDENGKNVTISQAEIVELKTVMDNMQTQSGCQPFGEEWNHTGPTPPMNPAMCLAEPDNIQPGNPRHNVGRTNVYQAKRDRNGNAHWVQSGQIPALSSGGGPQMVQHTSQAPPPNSSQWNGMSHTPGIDPRPSQYQSMPPPMQSSPYSQATAMPSNYGQPSATQSQFTQPYVGGSGTKPRRASSSGGKKKKSTSSGSGSRSKSKSSSKSKPKRSSSKSK